MKIFKFLVIATLGTLICGCSSSTGPRAEKHIPADGRDMVGRYLLVAVNGSAIAASGATLTLRADSTYSLTPGLGAPRDSSGTWHGSPDYLRPGENPNSHNAWLQLIPVPVNPASRNSDGWNGSIANGFLSLAGDGGVVVCSNSTTPPCQPPTGNGLRPQLSFDRSGG